MSFRSTILDLPAPLLPNVASRWMFQWEAKSSAGKLIVMPLVAEHVPRAQTISTATQLRLPAIRHTVQFGCDVHLVSISKVQNVAVQVMTMDPLWVFVTRIIQICVIWISFAAVVPISGNVFAICAPRLLKSSFHPLVSRSSLVLLIMFKESRRARSWKTQVKGR